MQQRVFIDQYEQKRFYLVCCYSRFITTLVDLEIRIFFNNLPNGKRVESMKNSV